MNPDRESHCLKDIRYYPNLMKITELYQTGGLERVASEWNNSAKPKRFFDYTKFLLFGQWCLAVDAYDLFEYILKHPCAPKDRKVDWWWEDHMQKNIFAQMAIEEGDQQLGRILMQWPKQTALPTFCAAVVHNDMPKALAALSVFDALTAKQPTVWHSYMDFTLSNASNDKKYSLVKALLGSWCGQCQTLNCSVPNHTGRLLISETASPAVIADALHRSNSYSEGSLDETGSTWLWRNPHSSTLTPEQIDVLDCFFQHPVWASVSSSAEVQTELQELSKRSVELQARMTKHKLNTALKDRRKNATLTVQRKI